MQAITVKFRGPTERGGSRYIAKAYGGSVVVLKDFELSNDDNRAAAAAALARKMGWSGRWIGGELPNGEAVFVPAESRDGFEVTS